MQTWSKPAQTWSGRAAPLVREGRRSALAIMIASQARMKSKLIEKGATLPSAPMRSKQVSGATEVQELPRLRDYAPGTDRVVFWQRDVRKAASGVSKGDTLLTGKPDFVTTTTSRTRRNGSSRSEVRAEARRCSRRVR